MEIEALVLLRDDPIAQRLVVAWPRVDAAAREAGGEERAGEWAAHAGVSIPDAARVGRILLTHGICLPDGTSDSLAVRYCGQGVARELAGNTPEEVALGWIRRQTATDLANVLAKSRPDVVRKFVAGSPAGD